MADRWLRSPEDILTLVEQWGFLPFFTHDIEGFSIEELTPGEYWFSDTQDGPWEWKGPTASSGRCIYGKFFRQKAGYVSREWMPDFLNVRRDGMSFEERYGEGLAGYQEKQLLETIRSHGSIRSKDLKSQCGYTGKDGLKGFDTKIARLQMQTYVTIADFNYEIDKYGHPYGWGVARYSTPELQFGEEALETDLSPEESRDKILTHLSGLFPYASDEALRKLVG